MSRLRWFLLVAVVARGATPLRAQFVQPNVIVSVRDQKLMLLDTGGNAAVYPVSTSKFGLGEAAILSLPASSGYAVWKLKMRMLITGAFTSTERRRKKQSADPPATVVFE